MVKNVICYGSTYRSDEIEFDKLNLQADKILAVIKFYSTIEFCTVNYEGFLISIIYGHEVSTLSDMKRCNCILEICTVDNILEFSQKLSEFVFKYVLEKGEVDK